MMRGTGRAERRGLPVPRRSAPHWAASSRYLCLAAILSGVLSCGGSSGKAPSLTPRQAAADYVIRFLPRYYTYKLQTATLKTVMISPSDVTPVFKRIVAPNDDSVYAATVLDLSQEPVVLTIPQTDLLFSVQLMDLQTEVLPNEIAEPAGQSYAFVGPGWQGKLPAGLQRIDVSANGIVVIVRANKGIGDEDVSSEARALVNAMTMRSLSSTRENATLVLPPLFFSQSNKLEVDYEAAETPVALLDNLQTAVRDPLTPLTRSDRPLIRQFDAYFEKALLGAVDAGGVPLVDDMAAGVADGFGQIHSRYLGADRTSTGWIYFPNAGQWQDAYLDRAAVSEYYIYAHASSWVQYYYVYQDEDGQPLTGAGGNLYEIRFAPGQLPQGKWFWSLTAYNNDAISFIPNSANQYNVPSYRPTLVKEPDGSVVVYVQQNSPGADLAPNWLPIDGDPFHVMLRIYEPEVPYANYEPPAVRRMRAVP